MKLITKSVDILLEEAIRDHYYYLGFHKNIEDTKIEETKKDIIERLVDLVLR